MTVASDQTCRDCGAPLAADQRYCLNCGRRRGEPRLDYRRHLESPHGAASSSAATNDEATASPAAAAPSLPVTEEQKPQRDFTPLAAAGGIAVLGLMLLVGVLIGRGDGNPTAAPPPQIVRVEGGGEAETAATEGGSAKGDAGAKKAAAKGGGKDGAPTGGGKSAPPAITASESELEALQEKSPQEYSEAAAKLPDEIATPGKAPPSDDKKPGGGSSGTTIE